MSVLLDNMLQDVLEEAAMGTNAGIKNVTDQIDVLWYYLQKGNIPGTKFDTLCVMQN